jgi:hypothetical protein
MTGFDGRFLEQFLISIALASMTVLTHFFGMTQVRWYFRKTWKQQGNRRTNHVVMAGVVAIMMGTHYLEVLIWAAFFYLRGIIAPWSSAMYYSLSSYTTLGDSNIILPPHWRGLGGFEALNAMLMFGWSTAMLASIILRVHGLDD